MSGVCEPQPSARELFPATTRLCGVDLLHRISSGAPFARVLVFSMHADASIVASAIKAPRAVARLVKQARIKLGIRRTSDLLGRAHELAGGADGSN